MKKLLILFGSGCLGALANSITVWLCGHFNITSALGVSIAPALTPGWLYPRIVWGGIWGFLFIFPVCKSGLFMKGAVLSLFPTAIQLFVVFPFKAHKGLAGIDLGLLTPLFVIFFNLVWGITTALAARTGR